MVEKSIFQEKILGKQEIIDAWNGATGQSAELDNIASGQYLSEKIFGKGESATLEYYPDLLNGKPRLVVEDFSAFEGDTGYPDCAQLVADRIVELRAAGLVFEVEVPTEFSDAGQILADIESRITIPVKNNVHQIRPEQVA
jgi:hypothetical protein